MTTDLNNIIESLKPITEYDLAGVEPTFHPIAGLSNVMREDVVATGLTRDQALNNAPAEQDGQFKIPPILGGESA
jgi:aspartyl-tRNA(Asn)/glutamyl-tRNA(Gln) amidotransferase subunit C